MIRYKVVSVKKRSLLQKALDAASLEKILNEQARDGWIYQNALMGESQLLEHDTFLIVFYREES